MSMQYEFTANVKPKNPLKACLIHGESDPGKVYSWSDLDTHYAEACAILGIKLDLVPQGLHDGKQIPGAEIVQVKEAIVTHDIIVIYGHMTNNYWSKIHNWESISKWQIKNLLPLGATFTYAQTMDTSYSFRDCFTNNGQNGVMVGYKGWTEETMPYWYDWDYWFWVSLSFGSTIQTAVESANDQVPQLVNTVFWYGDGDAKLWESK